MCLPSQITSTLSQWTPPLRYSASIYVYVNRFFKIRTNESENLALQFFTASKIISSAINLVVFFRTRILFYDSRNLNTRENRLLIVASLINLISSVYFLKNSLTKLSLNIVEKNSKTEPVISIFLNAYRIQKEIKNLRRHHNDSLKK